MYLAGRKATTSSSTWRWLAIACLAACGTKLNPLFCEKHPTDSLCGTAPDAGPECTTNGDCAAPTALCDVGRSTCVQCTTADTTACSGTTPVCGSDEACQACTVHTDCASAACLPDGSCGAETDVAYVDPAGTDNAACSLAAPCTKVANALATHRPFVKFHGSTAEQVSLTDVKVTWLADPGAALVLPSDGPLVQVDGTTKLQVFDLALNGADSASTGTGAGISMSGTSASVALTRVTVSKNLMGGVVCSGGKITVSQSMFLGNQGGGLAATSCMVTVSASTFTNNQGGGIVATSTTVTVAASTFSGNQGAALSATSISQITMDGSTMSGNDLGLVDHNGAVTISRSTFTGNPGGALSLTSDSFTIIGNVLFANGGPTTGFGGVGIANTAPDNSANRLELNSFSKNLARAGVGPAIQCSATGFTAKSNILSDNGTTSQLDQFGGSCTHTYSIVRPGALPLGTGNLAADPMFANGVTGDLHILAASPARGAADPAAVLTGIAATDIDGDARVAPADIGADQFHP